MANNPVVRCKLCRQDMSQPPRDGVADCPTCGQGLSLKTVRRIFRAVFPRSGGLVIVEKEPPRG